MSLFDHKSMRDSAQRLCFTTFERSHENDYVHSVFLRPHTSIVLLYNLIFLRPFDCKSMRALAYRLCFTTLERLRGNDTLGAPSYSSHSEQFKNALLRKRRLDFQSNNRYCRWRGPWNTIEPGISGRSQNLQYSSCSDQCLKLARKPLFLSYIPGHP